LRTLPVDFARPAAWPVAVLWTVVALLVAICGWTGSRDLRALQRLTETRDATQLSEQQLGAGRAAQAALAASANEAVPFAMDARRLMALSSVDVAGVLRSIETAQLSGAKVSQIDVDTATRNIELTLEVTSADVATSYLQALNAGDDRPAWSLVRVQSQGGTIAASIHGEVH
jgi:hypothetical protein